MGPRLGKAHQVLYPGALLKAALDPEGYLSLPAIQPRDPSNTLQKQIMCIPAWRPGKYLQTPGLDVQRRGNELDQEDAAAVASLIADAAHSRGMDAHARTPWIVEAARLQPNLLPWHLRLRPRGGKPDDCTVVIALMKRDNEQY